MRYTANGRAVANMRVACNRSYTTQDGERREETEWVRVVAWEALAELVSRYLAKGAQVYAEGHLRTRKWEDRDGRTRYTTEVIAQDILLLDRRGGGNYDGDSGKPAAGAAGSVDPDDLPFE